MSASHRPQLALADDFLQAVDVADHTRRAYRVALEALAEFVAGQARQRDRKTRDARPTRIIPLTRLKPTTLAQFRSWLLDEHQYQRRAVNTYLAGAVRFMQWLDVREALPASLSASRMLLILKEERRGRRSGYIPQPIKEAVPFIVRYYVELPDPPAPTPRAQRERLALYRNRALVQTLFATGVRVQELTQLRRSDYDQGDRPALKIIGKGTQPRRAQLNDAAHQALQAYLRGRDAARPATESARAKEPLFTRHDRDLAQTKLLQPITTRMVGEIIRRAAAALDLPETLSPHDFRRYVANTLLSQGMPLESVQQFLGHASIVTTRTVYAHSTWDQVLDDQLATYLPDPLELAQKRKPQ